MNILLLLLITSIPFLIYFVICLVQSIHKNPSKYLALIKIPNKGFAHQTLLLLLSAFGVILLLSLFIAPSQIKKVEKRHDTNLSKTNTFLISPSANYLGISFHAQSLNEHLSHNALTLHRTLPDKKFIYFAPVDVQINQLNLAESAPLYEYNDRDKSLIKVDDAYVSKDKSTYTTTRLQKISIDQLKDAYFLNGDSIYFEHNHNLIFTQNKKSDLHDFEYRTGAWTPDDDDDKVSSGTKGYNFNLNYCDLVEDGSPTQYVSSDSKYHAFSIKELQNNKALRQVHLNDYDYQTLLRHEWHPVCYTSSYNTSGKLHPVIYYQINKTAYYLPLTKLGNDYYYEIDPISKSLIFNKRAQNLGKDSAYYRIHHRFDRNRYNDTNSAVLNYHYYIKASALNGINGHELTVYNAPIEVSARVKQTLFDILLIRQPKISIENINKSAIYNDDPYNYRLNYSYIKRKSLPNYFASNNDSVVSVPSISNGQFNKIPIPTGRVLDETKYLTKLKNNANVSDHLYQTDFALNKAFAHFSNAIDKKDIQEVNSGNSDNVRDHKALEKKQVQKFNQILHEQKALVNKQMPKYANATLKGEQPDIQHLLALSFGYTNLDPDPNDPWKRNEAGSEPYLKFDMLSSSTAKHNTQPKYPINKVVYVQSIVRNSIKGRHNEFYLLAQGDDGNKRWTYPIMPNKYVHVSNIVNHKQIKTHYDNFLDTSIFAYHMLDLDRYNHYDNAFRFIPDYTTPHNVYQTSGQPGSRTTNETIYDTFLPPIDTAEDNLKQER